MSPANLSGRSSLYYNHTAGDQGFGQNYFSYSHFGRKHKLPYPPTRTHNSEEDSTARKATLVCMTSQRYNIMIIIVAYTVRGKIRLSDILQQHTHKTSFHISKSNCNKMALVTLSDWSEIAMYL